MVMAVVREEHVEDGSRSDFIDPFYTFGVWCVSQLYLAILICGIIHIFDLNGEA